MTRITHLISRNIDERAEDLSFQSWWTPEAKSSPLDVIILIISPQTSLGRRWEKGPKMLPLTVPTLLETRRGAKVLLSLKGRENKERTVKFPLLLQYKLLRDDVILRFGYYFGKRYEHFQS